MAGKKIERIDTVLLDSIVEQSFHGHNERLIRKIKTVFIKDSIWTQVDRIEYQPHGKLKKFLWDEEKSNWVRNWSLSKRGNPEKRYEPILDVNGKEVGYYTLSFDPEVQEWKRIWKLLELQDGYKSIKRIWYKEDKNTNEWMEISKKEVYYNNDGNLSLEVERSSSIEINKNIIIDTTSYFYDSLSKLKYKNYSYWSSSEESGYKKEYAVKDKSEILIGEYEFDHDKNLWMRTYGLKWEEDSDDTHNYHSKTVFQYDRKTNKWIGYERHTREYTVKNKIKRIASLVWDVSGNQWVTESSKEYTYHRNGNKKTKSETIWYLPFGKSTDKYGRVVYQRGQIQRMNGSKKQIVFDKKNGNQIKAIISSWDEEINGWVNQDKREMQYFGFSNRISLSIAYRWDTKDKTWQPLNKFEYNYNQKGKEIVKELYIWNQFGFFWDLKKIYITEVNDSSEVREEYSYDLPLDKMIGVKRSYILNNNLGDQILKDIYRRDYPNDDWILYESIKILDIETELNSIKTIVFSRYGPIPDKLTPSIKMEYHSDHSGNIVLEANSIWDTKQKEWIIKEKKDYYY